MKTYKNLTIGQHLELLNEIQLKRVEAEKKFFNLKQKKKKAEAREKYLYVSIRYGKLYNKLLNRIPNGTIIIRDKEIKNSEYYCNLSYTNKIIFI